VIVGTGSLLQSILPLVRNSLNGMYRYGVLSLEKTEMVMISEDLVKGSHWYLTQNT
jgi:hypothetical protein